MEGTLSNVHKFHTVYSSWHYREVQNDELLFSIRTSVPNFCHIIHFFPTGEKHAACLSEKSTHFVHKLVFDNVFFLQCCTAALLSTW